VVPSRGAESGRSRHDATMTALTCGMTSSAISCMERLLSAGSIWLNDLRLRLRKRYSVPVSYNLVQYDLLFSRTCFAHGIRARVSSTEVVQNVNNNGAHQRARYKTQNENHHKNQDMDYIQHIITKSFSVWLRLDLHQCSTVEIVEL
jgi:hypothetical protein